MEVSYQMQITIHLLLRSLRVYSAKGAQDQVDQRNLKVLWSIQLLWSTQSRINNHLMVAAIITKSSSQVQILLRAAKVVFLSNNSKENYQFKERNQCNNQQGNKYRKAKGRSSCNNRRDKFRMKSKKAKILKWNNHQKMQKLHVHVWYFKRPSRRRTGLTNNKS